MLVDKLHGWHYRIVRYTAEKEVVEICHVLFDQQERPQLARRLFQRRLSASDPSTLRVECDVIIEAIDKAMRFAPIDINPSLVEELNLVNDRWEKVYP